MAEIICEQEDPADHQALEAEEEGQSDQESKFIERKSVRQSIGVLRRRIGILKDTQTGKTAGTWPLPCISGPNHDVQSWL